MWLELVGLLAAVAVVVVVIVAVREIAKLEAAKIAGALEPRDCDVDRPVP